MGYEITQRTCKKCGELKPLDKEHFTWNSTNKCFMGICTPCSNKNRKIRYANRKIDLNTIYPEKRTYNKCNIEKEIGEFSYKKSINSYSYTCKYCDCQEKRFNWKRATPEEKAFLTERKRIRYKIANKLFAYRKHDEKKEREFDLDKEFIVKVLESNCVYCGYLATGLDRKDSNLGHTKDNCVPCCSECNTTKMHNYSYEEMLLLGKTIKEIKDNRKWEKSLEYFGKE